MQKSLLIYPSLDKPFVLVSDASASAAGCVCVLMQDLGEGLQLVDCASETNSPNYNATEPEWLAVVGAAPLFRSC